MDRRLLFPVIAVTAWGQPTSPAAADAEKALRARVDQFYQLEVNQDFRHAETLVIEESKDYFYNANKPHYQGFSFVSAEFSDNNTRARVTVKVKTEVFFPGAAAQVFELPSVSDWKLVNGEWLWYFDKNAALNTPFGRMSPGPSAPGSGRGVDLSAKAPDLAALMSQVSVNREAVTLTQQNPIQFVLITNKMEGDIGVDFSGTPINGVIVELEKNTLKPGETAGLRFRLTGKNKISGSVHIKCSPLGQEFDVKVSAN